MQPIYIGAENAERRLLLAMLADAFEAVGRLRPTSWIMKSAVEANVRRELHWLTRPATGEWGGSARDVCNQCGLNYGFALRANSAVIDAARAYLAACDAERAEPEEITVDSDPQVR